MLSLAQIHKQFYTPGVNGLDVPMNLMFNFCRVTSLVCAVRDGKALKEGKELKSREKVHAISEVPSFWDYWSYMYFCGGAISGPWYEYVDF